MGKFPRVFPNGTATTPPPGDNAMVDASGRPDSNRRPLAPKANPGGARNTPGNTTRQQDADGWGVDGPPVASVLRDYAGPYCSPTVPRDLLAGERRWEAAWDAWAEDAA